MTGRTLYQPLNLESDYSNEIGLSGLGNYGQQAPAMGGAVAQGAASVASTPGTIFSSLFGDNGMFSRNSLFGGRDAEGVRTMGWAPTALGIGQAIFGGLQGNKAMNLAESQLKEGKRQFDLNYNAQKQSTNTQLEDRQRARVASSPGAYESVDSYMTKNKVV